MCLTMRPMSSSIYNETVPQNINDLKQFGVTGDQLTDLIGLAKDLEPSNNVGNNAININQNYIRCSPGETLTFPDTETVSINPGKLFIFKCVADSSLSPVTIQVNDESTDTIDLLTSFEISTTIKGCAWIVYSGEGLFEVVSNYQ